MPNEFLCEIILSIHGEFSKTLRSLCLTCKHFRNVVEEHREPEYNLRGKWNDDLYAMTERLRDQPRLKHLIRVICMVYDFAIHTKYTEEEVNNLVTPLGSTRLMLVRSNAGVRFLHETTEAQSG
ncbi:hypothetical protein ST47_g8665 [Ascochyta rabiei]|uniref:Uncharacterized protein n=2 Tax=Didymella rabiei TaxID=5454 RepID=A0A162YR14_DIDRA|nr:hypothetical protein ST47_g8665 [Ascochyta rabiei]